MFPWLAEKLKHFANTCSCLHKLKDKQAQRSFCCERQAFCFIFSSCKKTLPPCVCNPNAILRAWQSKWNYLLYAVTVFSCQKAQLLVNPRWKNECFRFVPVGVYQISRQIKAHDGSVFTLCQMRNGMLLTGGGKDRKIILWDHDLNPEREIEVRKQERRGNCLEQGLTSKRAPSPSFGRSVVGMREYLSSGWCLIRWITMFYCKSVCIFSR